MELRNHTPFPGLAFKQYNARSELNGVLALRATFDIRPGEALTASTGQRPFLLKDEYAGEGQRSHLLRQADFVPFKPGTDVTVLGRAYAPFGRPQPYWLTGIKVGDRQKLLRVHGPRHWRPDGDGWRMGEAAPASEVPLNYYLAYGGPIPQAAEDDGPQDCCRFNPLGPGLLHPELSPRDQPLPAPRIEAAEEPITDWRQVHQPQGLAPIAPWWRFREQHTGTYDETWLATRHPFLPPDFDYRFYNCAHPDLVFTPWLRGDEEIRLANLLRDAPLLPFRLPGLRLVCAVHRKTGGTEILAMPLDGVHIDLIRTPPQVTLTWRVGFAWREGVRTVEAHVLGPAERVPAGDRQPVPAGASRG